MSTHSALGVMFPDGKITGCYVHYDGSSMSGRIKDFLEKRTTTGLVMLISRAQASGGMRSFHSSSLTNDNEETDFLDDSESYVITEKNWEDDHFGAAYRYLVEYDTGDVVAWSKYEDR